MLELQAVPRPAERVFGSIRLAAVRTEWGARRLKPLATAGKPLLGLFGGGVASVRPGRQLCF